LVISGESTGFLVENHVATSNVSNCNYLCILEVFGTFLLFFTVFQVKIVIFLNIDVQDGTHSHFSGKGAFLNAELKLDQVWEGSIW
jgi:hypothetical protein